MALPATDDFTGSNGDPLDVYSANWTCNDGGTGDPELEIQSNAASADDSSADEGAQHWNADAFNNDQYSEATVTSVVSGVAIGVAVRCNSGSTQTYYGWYSDPGASYLFECSAGSWNQIGTNGTAFSATDVIRIEASSTTITGYINAGEEKSGTNGNITSGYAGLCSYNAGAGRVDDWEGGNLGVSTPAISVSDTLALSDTPTLTGVPNVSVSDSLGASDSVTAALSDLLIAEAEALGLADSPVARLLILVSEAEALGLTDSTSVGALQLAATAAESLGLADSAAAGLGDLLATVADSLGLSAAASLALAIEAQASEGLGLADSVALAMADLGISAGETLTLSDSASLTVLEAGALALSVNDTLTIVDSPLASILILMVVAESLDVSDSPTASVESQAGPTLSISVTPDNPAYYRAGPVIVGS